VFPFSFTKLSVLEIMKLSKAWWISELEQLLPRTWSDWLWGVNRQTIRVTPAKLGALLELIHPQQGVVHREEVAWENYSAAHLNAALDKWGVARSVPMVLILPVDNFFGRSFIIPRMAQPRLKDIAEQEIERRTPFKLNEIYLTHDTRSDPRNPDRLTVDQLIVRRDLVLHACEQLQILPTAVSVVGFHSEQHRNVQTITIRSFSSRTSSWLGATLRPLAYTAICLVVATYAATWWKQKSAIAALGDALPSLHAQAQVVRTAIDEGMRLKTTASSLLNRHLEPSATQIWEETVRLLPDNSSLTELKIEGNRLSITGLSSDAAALVEILGKSTLLEAVALNSPITSDPVAQRDRFSIAAKIRGRNNPP
jgi:general secretion pathway protein L